MEPDADRRHDSGAPLADHLRQPGDSAPRKPAAEQRDRAPVDLRRLPPGDGRALVGLIGSGNSRIAPVNAGTASGTLHSTPTAIG